MTNAAVGCAPPDLDRELREIYNLPLRVVEASAAGLAFAVNRTWVASYSGPHLQLVKLVQLFYDVEPLARRGKMSTTALQNIRNTIITVVDHDLSLTELNDQLLQTYSSRHFLAVAPSARVRRNLDWAEGGKTAQWSTIRTRCNWARAEACAVRKRCPALAEYTTGRQLDAIAQGFNNALRKPDTQTRHRALERLEREILVDTRSSLGRPKAWYGLPVVPITGKRAWIQGQPQPHGPNVDWQLWIERNGVPETVLDNLRVHNIAFKPPKVDWDSGIWPWWARDRLVDESPTAQDDACSSLALLTS